MRDSKKSFKHESLHDTETVQAVLKAIHKGMARGKLSFSDDEDEITLEPQGLINLKLGVSQEDGRNRVTLRLTWQDEESLRKADKPLVVK